jgi:ankyrin repeat protein
LVKNGGNINTLDEEGNNALLFALKNDAPKDYIIKLLELGSDVSLSDKNGVKPLAVALAKRNYPIEIYEEIIKMGGDVNSLDGNKLVWDEMLNNPKADLLEVLLKNGAEIEKDGDYPICYFLREKFNTINDYDTKMEILDVLIKYEKKLNEAICGTYTPLSFAVKNNFPADVIRLLLSYGADPEVKDKGGISMVDYLSSREHYDDTIIIKTRENVTEGW